MLPQNYSYQPMPEQLEIKDSAIAGRGVFTNKNLQANYTFWEHETHYKAPHKLLRTRLGSYLNHSEDPNCKLLKIGDCFFLKTIKPISVGEELTLKYSLYECAEK